MKQSMKKNSGPIAAFLAAAEKRIGAWGPAVGMVLLCAMSVASVVICMAFHVERLDALLTYKTGTKIFGIAVCALVYIGCFGEKQRADKSTRLFMAMLFCDTTALFLDVAATLMDSVPELRGWIPVLGSLYYCNTNLLVFLFWRYICVYLPTEHKFARQFDRVMRAGLVLAELAALVNLFVPAGSDVGRQESYYETGGVALFAAYIFSTAYICVLLIFATLYLARVKASLRNKTIISLFYVFPVAQAILYFFDPNTEAYLPDSTMLAILLMYVLLVTERSNQLASTSAEMNMATRIQANVLPNSFPAFPKNKEFDISATMDPAKEVGGDFYDFFLIDSDHLAMVVADVSGKGVPAALFMMTARTILKTKAQSSPALSPREILNEVNAALSENNDESMFVTVWYGVLTISTGELTYSDAGHEKLLLYQNGAWRFLPKESGVALAVWEPEDLELMEEKYQFHDRTIRLAPGDAIFQYTDGVTEATDADNTLFGDERLLSAMNSAPAPRPGELLPHVRAKIDEFVQDAPQFDDITMLGLLYKGTDAG